MILRREHVFDWCSLYHTCRISRGHKIERCEGMFPDTWPPLERFESRKDCTTHQGVVDHVVRHHRVLLTLWLCYHSRSQRWTSSQSEEGLEVSLPCQCPSCPNLGKIARMNNHLYHSFLAFELLWAFYLWFQRHRRLKDGALWHDNGWCRISHWSLPSQRELTSSDALKLRTNSSNSRGCTRLSMMRRATVRRALPKT